MDTVRKLDENSGCGVLAPLCAVPRPFLSPRPWGVQRGGQHSMEEASLCKTSAYRGS